MPLTPLPSSEAATATSRPAVLFVEDNLTQLDLYAFVLSDDLEIVTATRGEEGYALACAERFDAILLDAILPDVSGLIVRRIDCSWRCGRQWTGAFSGSRSARAAMQAR